MTDKTFLGSEHGYHHHFQMSPFMFIQTKSEGLENSGVEWTAGANSDAFKTKTY